MDIYVVQEGDSIWSIAERYGILPERLVLDNGLVYPYSLVIGQSIVIAYPKQVHIVQEGENLQSIADLYGVTVMQLYKNNPYLFDRDYLYVGETLIISYNTTGSITTTGFGYAYIRKDTLKKILPNLTYLSIFNYTTIEQGNIVTYEDDTEIIQTTKEYGVVPLLMLATLTRQGEPDIEASYELLLNEEYQKSNIEQFLNIVKSKGYGGVNIVFNNLNESNQSLYINFIRKISERLQQENLIFFVTINHENKDIDGSLIEEGIDYSQFSNYVTGLLFLKFVWGTNNNPPGPVSNLNNIKTMTEYILTKVPRDKVIIGIPIIGYDWQLPYIPDRAGASSLTINSVMALAYNVEATILFDEASLTPYFYYEQYNISIPAKHIVWFIDARSIAELNNIIKENTLAGSGIWNIMIYHPQLWTIINSQFDVVKRI
jgi:spore germination protein